MSVTTPMSPPTPPSPAEAATRDERVRIPHNAALDGLRGLAVAGVLLFHGQRIVGGYLGVDLFFVLSGFLITSLLLAESTQSGTIALGGFWARRARRLLPALAGLLVGVVVYWARFASPDELRRIRGDALATIAYVANWRAVVTDQDYWALFRAPSPLEHTWSLAIEEQFYLVWPLVFLLAVALWKRRTAVAILAISLVGTLASVFAMQVTFDPRLTTRAYYGTDTRAAAIFLGAGLASAIAIIGPAKGRRTRIAIECAAILGVLIIGYAWLNVSGNDPRLYRGGFVVVELAVCAIILAVMHPTAGPLTKVFSWRPLVWAGLISYGLYLWHWPVNLVITGKRTGLGGWPLFGAQLTVTCAIAIASYFLLEQPIRRGFGNRRFWTLMIPATSIAVVALVVVTTATDAPSSVVSRTPIGAPTTRPSGGAEVRQQFELQKYNLDTRVPVSAPRVLLGGDSVAWTLAASAPYDQTAPVAIANASNVGCGLSRGAPVGSAYSDRAMDDNCKGWPAAMTLAAHIFRPRAIVSLPGAWDLLDRRINGRAYDGGSKRLREHIETRLDVTADIAADHSARLVLVTLPCLSPTFEATSEYPASMVRQIGDPKRVNWLNRIVRDFAAAHPDQVDLIDLHEFACAEGSSDATLSGDGVHFTLDGGRRVWAWIIPQLQQILGEPLGSTSRG